MEFTSDLEAASVSARTHTRTHTFSRFGVPERAAHCFLVYLGLAGHRPGYYSLLPVPSAFVYALHLPSFLPFCSLASFSSSSLSVSHQVVPSPSLLVVLVYSRRVIVDRVLASRLHCRRYCISGLLPPENKGRRKKASLALLLVSPVPSFPPYTRHPLFTLSSSPPQLHRPTTGLYKYVSPLGSCTRNRARSTRNTENRIDTEDESAASENIFAPPARPLLPPSPSSILLLSLALYTHQVPISRGDASTGRVHDLSRVLGDAPGKIAPASPSAPPKMI